MKIGTTRVETFSDSVMAIIITIMVMELIPDFSAKEVTPHSYFYNKETLAKSIAYLLSFTMIGIFWLNHHNFFHILKKTNEQLLIQNLGFLFIISIIPVTTTMIGANPSDPLSVALYGGVMLLTTILLSVMRVYAERKALIHKEDDKNLNSKIFRMTSKARKKNYIGIVAYLISIPLAFISVYISFACFVIPPIIFFIPDGVDDEKLAEKIAEKE
ncbi:TMEM175 family protein [Chryseosolibacter indicus]|uniref:DUF1211 domain-containing protein n=1 Tax=Chryseosolibacter indicus TaxID=2782351 RepID=A0ABS5VL51_9BACT|nr:TMEM175 family protein [Chryseosolibacter indicus]MBT1702167.1 DUF1211 domain-containing protein [Chryseosolibacter indicus]